MGIHDIEIVAYRPEYGLEVVKMWRQSFQRAMNIQEQNHSDELSGQLNYFCTIDPTSIRIAIDCSSSTIAGLMVIASGELDHLYINVEYQGSGLGSRLLNEAKLESPQSIELYTFQKNSRAQVFYESHGFSEIERGYAELEGNPWASSKEELADIKYKWTAER
jgi:ribosomal protein S18 acetylase RimI-like enzyme